MGPFPFIQFGQAEINGSFGDEFTYRKIQLQDLIDLFIVDYFVGLKIFVAENQVTEQVIIKNAAPYFASLEVTFPNPRPSNTGAFSYSFTVKNSQTDYSFFNIILNGTDGIITSSSSDPYLGSDQIDSATNRPYIAEELKIAKTLSVYQQNGAAIFPDTFTFDSTTGIAERRLLRAYDWKFSETFNQPQRDGITDLRVIPKTVLRLRELSQIEKSMVSFFLEKPIKESITNDNWNQSNIYLDPLPEGWYFYNLSSSSSKKLLAVINDNQIALTLAGIKYSGKWYFQRFINPYYTNGGVPDLAALLSTDIPANPTIGKMYQLGFFDFDQCEFGTVENEEPFIMTIRSGDSYQINIPSEFIFEPEIGQESDQFPMIGIFDCNIGQFKKPDCSLFMVRVIEIPDYEYNNVIDGTTDVFVNGIDLLGNVIGVIVSVPIADIDTTTINSWASSFCNAVTLIDSDVLVTFEFVTGKLILTFTINYTVIGTSYLRLTDAVNSYTINGIAASLPCIYRGGTIIGQLKSPYIKEWRLFYSDLGNYYSFAAYLAETFDKDIILKTSNIQFEGIDTIITIPYANQNISSLENFAISIANYLSVNDYPTYYQIITRDGIDVISFFTIIETDALGINASIDFPASISFSVFTPNATQYQASITIPPLLNSNYFIGIFQSYGLEGNNYSSLLAISQPLQLDNFEDFTQILEYGANENSIIEGFEYINGWLQRIRVPLNGAGQTAKSEESIYRNSDGTFQKPENSTDEVLYLHTDYLDLQTQRAMISATKNPIFVLGGQNLSVQGDLEITNNQDFTQNSSYRKLQQMKFQALTQGYQPENNSCIG